MGFCTGRLDNSRHHMKQCTVAKHPSPYSKHDGVDVSFVDEYVKSHGRVEEWCDRAKGRVSWCTFSLSPFHSLTHSLN